MNIASKMPMKYIFPNMKKNKSCEACGVILLGPRTKEFED
jgi:uncharacterized membrane protein